MNLALDLPELVVDTREQTPLTFINLPADPGTLYTGDYSIRGFEDDFAIERKTIPDLVASLTRERDRFMRELLRLRGCAFRRLLIVGSVQDIEKGNYRSKASPRSIMASLSAIEARFYLPILFEETEEQAALRIERLAFWSWREHAKHFIAIETPSWAI